MNDIVREKRNRLKINTVSSLMFVKLNGPDLAEFDPMPYVKSWLAAGGRPSTSWKTGAAATMEPAHQSKTKSWVS